MKKIIFICLMIIYSFSVHADSLAERWALTVPSVTENNMSQLVHYLTKGINNKYEQAKAIAVWIAAHVAYDNYSYSAMTGGKVSNRLQKVPKRSLKQESEHAKAMLIFIQKCWGWPEFKMNKFVVLP